jgi:predicted nucleic acid-binding protein
LPQKVKKRKPRAVVDTSVLVAGISGFREPFVSGRNPSAHVLHRWTERNNFVWLITEDILEEYKEVLKRLRVRPNLIGKVVNLIRERAEEVKVRASAQLSPDPEDDVFCLCAESGKADFLITFNTKDFPQVRLRSKVVLPAEVIGRIG